MLVSFLSAIAQVSYIKKISYKFNIMKLRFSKKKAIRRKRKYFRKLETIHNTAAVVRESTISVESSAEPSGEADENSEFDETSSESSMGNNVTDLILAKTNDEDVPDWSDLSFADKKRLFNEWSLVLIFSNLLTFIGSVFMLLTGSQVYREAEVMLGFGALMAWIALPTNYENIKSYNIITNTIINSASILAKSLIGIMPVYIGFSFFALCIFLVSPRFVNLTTSLFTCFALMNTEGVIDIFLNVFKLDWLLSQLFHYLFLFISICIIQNVFLIIIGDGYVKSKYFHKNNWVKAGDTGIKDDEDCEDPLEAFEDKNEKAEKSTRALVRILRADKEILLTEYYQSIGRKYSPNINQGKKMNKSPEHLTRLISSEFDNTLAGFEQQLSKINSEGSVLENLQTVEYQRATKLDKAQLVIKAFEHKYAEITKDIQ